MSLTASFQNLTGILNAEYDALLHGMCSTTAATLAAGLAETSAKSVSDTQAAWTRIDRALPDWHMHLPGQSLAALNAARAGTQPIGEALSVVAQNLATLERHVVADASASVLTTLGYVLERAAGRHTSAIEARRGHETFLVVVGDQGRVTTDHAGLSDESCSDRQQEYTDAMRERGLLFDDEVSIRHHDPRGGSPIANAARARAESLAAGAVIDGDSGTTTATLFAPTTSRANRLNEGGIK